MTQDGFDGSSARQVHREVAMPALASGESTKLLIGGEWLPPLSGKTFESVDPSTTQSNARVAEGSKEDVDAAVAAARRAFEQVWSRTKPAERQKLLLQVADLVERDYEEISTLDALDMGMPITRGRSGLRIAVGQLRYNASLAMTIAGETIENSVPGNVKSHTLREPIGVVGAIMAWNGPANSFLRKVSPALAAGCVVVVKPAEEASLTMIKLAELFLEAGCPPGVLSVVTGRIEAGEALASHHDVDLVTFTGSYSVGRAVIRGAAEHLTPTLIEAGGKSPNIVFADASMESAVAGSAMAIFSNSGQVCSAGSRLLVQADIYEEFTERVAAHARSLIVGDAMDPQVDIGPVASEKQLARINRYISLGIEEGAQLLDRGAGLRDSERLPGYFVAPTVFSRVKNDMRIAQEEIFGPVLSAIPFSDAGEATSLANSSRYGLGAGVWTSDLSTAYRMSQGLKAGSVWVNCYNALDPAVPFGGYKGSGYGRERGRQHFDAHFQTKAVWTNVQ